MGKNYIDTSGGYFNCFYQLVDGEYIFSIRGNDEVGMLTTIRLGLFNLELNERLYLLSENTIGNAWAGARFLLNINSSELSTTSTQNSGELIITKFDDINNIVSGTFWFNVENPYTGELVEIREGRFDTLFTQ